MSKRYLRIKQFLEEIITNYEKETIINYNAEEKFAEVYKVYEPDIRKMDKIVSMREEAEVVKEFQYGKAYRISKSWIKIRPKRILTEKEKERLREKFLKKYV